MHLDRGIRYTNQLLLASRQRELSEIEILILRSIWLDVSYQQSSQNSNYEVATIKNAASKLLHDISDAIGERVSKKNCKGMLSRRASTSEEQVDWGDAPTDMQPFCGRVDELGKLTQWLTIDRCRIAQGMGTALRLTFSPDGKYLAVSDTNYQIEVWEVATNQEIAMLIGHQSWVWDVQFSHDCKYLISGSSDETMRIWDLASGECLQVLHGHRDWVWRVSFAANSNLAISIGADRQFKIWWWRTKLNLLTFPVPDLQVRDGTFHGGRGLLATCGGEGIKIWQIWTGRRLQKIDTLNALNLRLVSLSPDRKTIVGANFSCTIHCWDVNTGSHLFDLLGHTDYVQQLLFIDDRTIISQSYDKTIRQWDLTTGEWKILICMELQYLIVLCRSPDCQSIAIGSDLPSLIILDRHTGQTSSYPAVGNRLRHLAFSHDGRFIIGTTDNRILNLWDLTCNYQHNSWKMGERDPTATIPHPTSSHLLIIGSDDGTISIWDLQDRVCVAQIVGHQHEILALKIVSNPPRLVSCSVDGSIKVWGLQDARLTELCSIDFGTPYQNLQLSGVKGLNRSQLDTLARLGAIKQTDTISSPDWMRSN